jgi:hypothetical protein
MLSFNPSFLFVLAVSVIAYYTIFNCRVRALDNNLLAVFSNPQKMFLKVPIEGRLCSTL